MYTFELFKIGEYFGYHILQDGGVIISQEFAPDLDGYTPMTEATAIKNAGEVIGRLQGGS